MAQFINMHKVELTDGCAPVKSLGLIHQGDHLANRCGARVEMNRAPVALGGSCVGYFIRADGAEVPLTGTISGNEAYVELDSECYQAEGQVSLFVKWVNGAQETTLISFAGSVVITESGVVIQPVSTPIPDLTQLLAEINTMREATAAANAAAAAASGFAAMIAQLETAATAAAPHTKGSYFVQGATVYKAKDDIAQGDTLVTDGSGANCESTTIGAELEQILARLAALEQREPSGPGAYGVGTFGTVVFG